MLDLPSSQKQWYMKVYRESPTKNVTILVVAVTGRGATSIHAKTELPRLGSAMGKVGLARRKKKSHGWSWLIWWTCRSLIKKGV